MITSHVLIDVTVSLPPPISVNEGDGEVLVCTTLSVLQDTERDFDVALVTNNNTGEYR